MELDISKKYKPLFELLSCWKMIESDEFKDLSLKEKKRLKALSKVDTVLISGGRDSGKTFTTSIFAPVAAKDYGHRIMYTRYTMSSTDHSISKSIDNRIEMLGTSYDFETTSNYYKAKEGLGEIVITGQKTSSNKQTAKMKGIEDFTMFITDEGEELPEFEEWDKARKSIRGKDVQCLSIIIFNPPTREHFIYEEFFDGMEVQEGFCGIKENIMYIHTDYRDNWEHLAEHNKREYLKLRKSYDEYEDLNNLERESASAILKKHWSKFKHVVLGGFVNSAEGVIYEDWVEGEFNNSLPFCFGLDFGFNDPDALTRVAVDRKRKLLYLKEEYFKNNTGADELAQIVLSIAGHQNLVIGDAAQKRLINDLWNNHGINIKKCKKGAGSVQRGIKTIQGYTLVVDPDSKNIKKSLNNYVWHDKRSGVPKHDWSDLCDSFRYAAMELINY